MLRPCEHRGDSSTCRKGVGEEEGGGRGGGGGGGDSSTYRKEVGEEEGGGRGGGGGGGMNVANLHTSAQVACCFMMPVSQPNSASSANGTNQPAARAISQLPVQPRRSAELA